MGRKKPLRLRPNAPNRFGLVNVMAQALVVTVLVSVLVAGQVAAQSFWDQLLVGVELMVGESVAQSVVAEYGDPVQLPPVQQRHIEKVFADIVARAGRKEIPYTLSVLGSDVINAFAAPGGYIFITTGLLHYIGDDTDALANVLGHEVAHVEHKHGMNALTRQVGLGVLLQLILGDSDQVVRDVVAIALELTRLGWSREQEYESDDRGQRLAAAAGYDPMGMVRFFKVLQELQGDEIPFLEFLGTHPLTSNRIERAHARALALGSKPEQDGIPRTLTRGAGQSSN